MTDVTVAPGARSTRGEQDRGGLRRADSVARGGAIALIGQVSNAVGGFALLALAGHWLGAAETGVVFGATAAFTVLFNTAKLGGDTAMIRFASGLVVTGRQGALRALLRTGLVPAICAGTFIALIGAVFSSTWAHLLYADVPVDDGRKYVLLAALFLPMATATQVLLGFNRGLGFVGPGVWINMIFQPLGRPILLGLVVAFGGGLLAFYVSWLLPVAVGLCLSTWVVRRNLSGVRDGGAEPVSAREFWSFGAPRAVAGILDICAPWVGVIILSGAVSSTSAASFAAVTRIVALGTIVMIALRQATNAHVGGAFAKGDRHMIESLQFTTTAWMVLVSWPFFLITLAFPHAVLSVFGGGFSEGSTALMIVAVASLANLATGNAQITVLMSGKSTWNLIGAATALTTQIGLGAILVPHYGVAGAGWGLGGAIVAENIVAYIQVRRGLRFRIWNRAVIVSAVTALVASGAGILVGREVSTGLLGVLLAGAVAVAVLAAAAWRFRRLLITPEFTTAFGHKPATAPSAQGLADAEAADDTAGFGT